ncbi:MAG: HisA/HisF-related TIM barrel protein [Acidimicrobiia bacterium]|nr:HisA/HisF-related TIM barrel protein [Acidimicrobiia bacterium]
MDMYARVNILDGRAVRLPRGDVATAISLEADPVARAVGWVEKGADKLLIIDLDAAAFGNYGNRPLVHSIIEASDVPVVVGGGVRSTREVAELLEAGASRVTMGTVALVDQVLFWELCREHPGQILVSLDVKKDEELVMRGWTEHSGAFLEEALVELSSAGAAGFMIAEAGRDALEEPPNHSALQLALRTSSPEEEVVAAGGVRNLDDLEDLVQLEADGQKLSGVVVGREITAGRFTFEEARAVLSLG